MGWLISIAFLIVGSFTGNDCLIVTSGLFAIAGSIAFASHRGESHDKSGT